jgi:hypothetical protein
VCYKAAAATPMIAHSILHLPIYSSHSSIIITSAIDGTVPLMYVDKYIMHGDGMNN